MDQVERFEHAGKTVTIYYDTEPPNPRKEYDNLAVLTCSHGHYVLGDEQHAEPMTDDEVRAKVADDGDEVLAILPLYLYDHSGITMSTRPFSCPWDSGQVGWGYVTRKRAESMGFAPGKANDIGEVYDATFFEEQILLEVSIYDSYLTEQCYGYEVTGRDGEVLDSCWGFIGDLDYVRREARDCADGEDDPAIDREAEELAARATFAMNVSEAQS